MDLCLAGAVSRLSQPCITHFIFQVSVGQRVLQVRPSEANRACQVLPNYVRDHELMLMRNVIWGEGGHREWPEAPWGILSTPDGLLGH